MYCPPVCPQGLENLLLNSRVFFLNRWNSLSRMIKPPEGTYLTPKTIYSRILLLEVISKVNITEMRSIVLLPQGLHLFTLQILTAFFISSLLNQTSSRRKLFKIGKDNCESCKLWDESSIRSHFNIYLK